MTIRMVYLYFTDFYIQYHILCTTMLMKRKKDVKSTASSNIHASHSRHLLAPSATLNLCYIPPSPTPLTPGRQRRKVRLIEGNAKCRHLKKMTCRGTLRQVFICMMPKTPSPTLTHCIRVYSTVYLFTQGRGGRVEP